VVTAIFLSTVTNGIYEGLQREVPEQLVALFPLALVVSLAAWFWSYCLDHRLEWLLDMGWFLLLAWFLLMPYYLVKHEGRRGLGRIGLFLLTYFAAWASGWAVSIWTRVLNPSE
jgi:hypothetical protein